MTSRRRRLAIIFLALCGSAAAADKPDCAAAPNPPKLPVTRPSGLSYAGKSLKVPYVAGLADTWKDSRREIAAVPAGTMVEVLEDLIVVEAPDVVWVTTSVEDLHLRQGDTILRYARLGEGSADLWAAGCWYKDADAGFITEPDGGGCGGPTCSAKVTKMGRQSWWFRIRLPNGKAGWTLSQSLDLSAGG
jgi:hypothetical protein